MTHQHLSSIADNLNTLSFEVKAESDGSFTAMVRVMGVSSEEVAEEIADILHSIVMEALLEHGCNPVATQ